MPQPYRWKAATLAAFSALALAFVFAGFGQATYAAGIGTKIAQDQEGSPLKIVSVTSNTDGLFQITRVVNSGAKKITAITFGSLIHDQNVKGAQPMFVAGLTLPTALEPGKSEELSPRLIDMDLARQAITRFPTGAVAEFGVLEARFADGSRYTYDARKLGRFGKTVPPTPF